MNPQTAQQPLVSLHFCTSNSWGGLEVYAGTLMRELSQSGIRVIAVCAESSPLHGFLAKENIQTVVLPSRAKISIASIRFVRSLIHRENISVLHVHFHRDIWIASAAVRAFPQVKLLMSIYMGVGRKKDLLHRWVYRRVDGIFTSSKALNELLPERYPVPSDRIHYLPYGRYLGKYILDESTRHAIRAKHNISSESIVAGSMVRLDEGKGVMDFIQSFVYLDKDIQSRVVYLVVGEPTRKSSSSATGSPFEAESEAYYRSLVQFVEQNGLSERIRFVGYQSETVAYLSAMDVFVFPSRDEMYSLAMLDAMAMSLPVVAARSGGNLLQVRGGINGLMYTTGDSKDLARVLGSCIADPALRLALGKAARAFVEEEHTMQSVINRLKEFYRAR